MEARKLNSYSYEEYLDIDASLRDGERCELIFGEIVMMAGASAAHQDVVGNLLYQLKNRLKQGEKKCQARIAPFDLKLHVFTQTHVVQPDVMLFCEGKELPCAIFEVLSPTTAAKDRGVKKELYEAAGVKEYLIVDPELKIVDAYLLEKGLPISLQVRFVRVVLEHGLPLKLERAFLLSPVSIRKGRTTLWHDYEKTKHLRRSVQYQKRKKKVVF